MGLDMYAYAAAKAGLEWDGKNQREIAYWRKHPNLHGWMEQLWRSRNTDPSADPMFNGVELELLWEDLEHWRRTLKMAGSHILLVFSLAIIAMIIINLKI